MKQNIQIQKRKPHQPQAEPAPFNPEKLLTELKAAGLKVISADSLGNVTLQGDQSAQQLSQLQAIKAAHTPQDPAADLSKAYLAAGITPEAMLEALWDLIILKDSKRADSLQAARSLVDGLIN